MKKQKTIFGAIFIFLIVITAFLIFINQKNKAAGITAKNASMQKIDNNIISVPVDVYIIKYTDKKLSSSRDKENVKDVFNEANRIWEQANISLNVSKIEYVTVNDASAYYNLNKILFYMLNSENYNQKRINTYFVKTLHGSNGVTFSGNVIMVADKTTVYDFRATSHEIGHVLGLKHAAPTNRLMARGVNGFELSEEEIIVARKNALKLFYQA